MVQIIDENRRPSKWSLLGQGIAEGSKNFVKDFGNLIQEHQKEKKLLQQVQKENEVLQKRFPDINFSAIKDPKMRQKLVEQLLKGELDKEKHKRNISSFGDKYKSQYDAKYRAQLNLMNTLDLGNVFNDNEDNQNGFNPQYFNDQNSNEEQSFNQNPNFQTQSQQSKLIPQKKIAQMAMVNPAVADKMQKYNDQIRDEARHKENISEKRYMQNRKEETEISKPVLLELNQARKNIPFQEQAIEDIKNASQEVSGLDYIADLTGFEPLRSPAGAKLKTAIKDFFLSDLTRVGSRPNMWIEQQLNEALPKIGRSTEANLITAEGMQFKVDLAKKRIELIDELAEEDRKKYGFAKADIDSRANKLMKSYVMDRQKVLEKNIVKIQKDFKESKKPNTLKKVKKGTILSPEIAGEFLEKYKGDRSKAEKAAKALGYEF
jgi:hypothetical protein